MEDSLTGNWGNRNSDDFRYQIAFDFVAHINEIMEAEGVDRSELAKALGVTKGRVSQILNSPGNLTLRVVVDYARTLGHKVAIVTYKDGDPENAKGPIAPQVFVTCWEKADRPTDSFSRGC